MRQTSNAANPTQLPSSRGNANKMPPVVEAVLAFSCCDSSAPTTNESLLFFPGTLRECRRTPRPALSQTSEGCCWLPTMQPRANCGAANTLKLPPRVACLARLSSRLCSVDQENALYVLLELKRTEQEKQMALDRKYRSTIRRHGSVAPRLVAPRSGHRIGLPVFHVAHLATIGPFTVACVSHNDKQHAERFDGVCL